MLHASAAAEHAPAAPGPVGQVSEAVFFDLLLRGLTRIVRDLSGLSFVTDLVVLCCDLYTRGCGLDWEHLSSFTAAGHDAISIAFAYCAWSYRLARGWVLGT